MSSDKILSEVDEELKSVPPPAADVPAEIPVNFRVETHAGLVVLRFSQPVPGVTIPADSARILANALREAANIVDPQRKRHGKKG